MSRKEQRYRKNQRVQALFDEVTNFTQGTLQVDKNSALYKILATHPRNASRVDDIVIWESKGFLGYRK